MCGIAGIIATKEEHLHSIKKMTDIIQHRGPNGNNIYQWNNVALGHLRLSIIDLSEGGKQPMHWHEQYTITYNGEVYNYIEIKKELEEKGYSFSSHSDTEVMLAAYDCWKEDCLSHFNGMFAFAIIDKANNKLFCARDRFGVKPFYYYQREDYFAFASEIKAFTVLQGWQAIANKERVYEFLKFGLQDLTHETMFENVYQLKGGHYLLFDLTTGEKQIQKWFDITQPVDYESSSSAEETFKKLFSSSVNLRLRADVKVGSCLSGGLDSSSVVLTVNEQLRALNKEELQETVSSCFENKKYDEQEYIDAVVEKAKCINHKIFPDLTDLYKQLSKIVWHQDEPFGSTSVFAQWSVFKKAREENITVMLDGQGADEILAGYHSYYGVYLWELIKKGEFKKLNSEIKGVKSLGLYSNGFIVKEIIKNAVPLPVWLTIKKLGKKEKDCISYTYQSTKHTADDISFSSVQQMSYSQVVSSNLPMLLHFEDRDSMAFSIEARVPFLDYRLAQFIYNLPASEKISNGITKSVLRRAMQNVLPAKVLNRKDKMGFVTPEAVWVKEYSAQLRSDLEKAVTTSNGFINKNIVAKFDNVVAGREAFDFTVWRALCFAKWIEVFNVKI